MEEEFIESENKTVKNPWKLASAILAVACVFLLVIAVKPSMTGRVISGSSAGENLVDYLSSRVGSVIKYVSSEDLGNIYQVNVEYQGDIVPLYVTKDGLYFLQGVVPITQTQPEQEIEQDIPKSDIPKVELFVMTHCPYGTQAEKGMIPVLELLGDAIEGKIRFVHYFMHGDEEEEETYAQVCIREEQEDKFIDYLTCFLEDGDSERCLSEAEIDKTALNTCITGNAERYYEEDASLSEQYGVQGSPTLVVNGVIVSSGRSSAAYLDVVCSSFNIEAGQCDEELSSQTPNPMWGWDSSGQETQAQC